MRLQRHICILKANFGVERVDGELDPDGTTRME
jgi:hypothetical protein